MTDSEQTPPEDGAKLPTGHGVVQGYLRTLDASPGVYRMLNAKAEVLYVGKARNLKARVTNYSRPSPQHSGRIARMISETASMMFLTTRTETEALLLEQNLIKQLKPRYNVLLRDDKSFPNILIGKEHAFPQLKKHRGKRTEKGSYFGPFASAGRGEPHAEPVAEGVLAAQLHRCDVRKPDAAVSAVPDQALFRALCRPGDARAICLAGGGCRAVP